MTIAQEAVSAPPVVLPGASAVTPPATKTKRRVKIFTVHGTFDHEAGWDNWDAQDATRTSDAKAERQFVNRLSDELAARGITFADVDHTQYNWSGGNSHDERRTAAIGLKKLIETEMKGRERDYDGVYVIGHSHGGTITRLAMNLWDKDSSYYDPSTAEFKNDDHCTVCKQQRNGPVGPNTVARPDRVFTFGSPFVTFEKRRGGLLSAKIATWSFRMLLAVPLIAYMMTLTLWADVIKVPLGKAMAGLSHLLSPMMALGLHLLLPVLITWLLGIYAPARFLAWADRRWPKSTLVSVIAIATKLIAVGGVALLAGYVYTYATGGWSEAQAWYPSWLWWVLPAVLYWLMTISVPGRLLGWFEREVLTLKEKLPKKYDPSADTQVAYVSYHTPGDEAGMGLHVAGFITWLLQTLTLSAAYVLAAGLALAVIAGAEALMLSEVMGGRGLLNAIGISPSSQFPEQQRHFIMAMDVLTALPAAIWGWIGPLIGQAADLKLGAMVDANKVAEYVPGAMVKSVASILFGLMPAAVLVLVIGSIVNSYLRSSGMVFGSEHFTWTLANRIGITRRANANTQLRNVMISPEAWWKREIAHCYYYKCQPVIADIADFIADPARHKPDRPWPIRQWLSRGLKWLVVALSVLSIFAMSVPFAKQAATTPLFSTPTCKAEATSVRIILDDKPTDLQASEAHVEARARPLWEAEVRQRFGAAWASWDQAIGKGFQCSTIAAGAADHVCRVAARPCESPAPPR